MLPNKINKKIKIIKLGCVSVDFINCGINGNAIKKIKE
jgi:hypothetical protein